MHLHTAKPFTLSIARTFGSGGGIIGSNLAKRLEIQYLDREIVMAAAKQLGVDYKAIESFDEKPDSFWHRVLQAFQFGDFPVSPAEFIPSDEKVHQAESAIILSKATNESFVVVGRGANFILNHDPNHVSILIHAEEADRVARIVQMYQIGESDARKLMHKTDTLREAYVKQFTGQDLYDSRHYHLTINSSKMSLGACEDTIMAYLAKRFGQDHIMG